MPRMGDPTLSVVLPAYNEAPFLRQTVETIRDGLRARGLAFEVVVVENGSRDETAELARQLERDHAEVRAISLAEADYGMALRTGLLASRGVQVGLFDVDYYDLDFLDRALDRLGAGDEPAVVVGSKRAVGATDTRPALRRLVTATFSSLLKLAFGLTLSDTHGMKAVRRDAVIDLVPACQLNGDMFDTELILRVERAGRVTAELPVVVNETRPSRTSIVRRGARTVLSLARLFLTIGRWRR